MRPEKSIGRHRDIPHGPHVAIPASAAGTSTDFETVIYTQPTIPTVAGTVSELPMNSLNVRSILLTFTQAITGVATNNFALKVNVRRAGNVLGTALATVTYASGTNESAFVPRSLSVPMTSVNALLPGDVVTVQRISAGTGLASPNFTIGLDLVPAGINL